MLPRKQQVRKQSAEGKFSEWGFQKTHRVLLLLLFQQQRGSLSGNTGGDHSSQVLAAGAVKKMTKSPSYFLDSERRTVSWHTSVSGSHSTPFLVQPHAHPASE